VYTAASDAEGGEGLDLDEEAQYAAAAAVDYEYSGEGPVPPELYFGQQVRVVGPRFLAKRYAFLRLIQ
jgi:hypothetical protein